MKLLIKIVFLLLILTLGCYVLRCMNNLEGFKEGYGRGGRRGGGRHGGGRRGGGRGRRWFGDGYGYGYGRRGYGRNGYNINYYPNNYGYNNLGWRGYMYSIPVVSSFYNYWNSCKNGCINLGNGEWGCQYPGNGPNDCTFATDCYGCGNVY